MVRRWAWGLLACVLGCGPKVDTSDTGGDDGGGSEDGDDEGSTYYDGDDDGDGDGGPGSVSMTATASATSPGTTSPGTTTASTTSPSTTSPTSMTASTTASPTATDSGPDDCGFNPSDPACQQCLSDNCCDEVTACNVDPGCACVLECVEDAGTDGLPGCLQLCDGQVSPELIELGMCQAELCPKCL
jgi:hypothetical protein